MTPPPPLHGRRCSTTSCSNHNPLPSTLKSISPSSTSTTTTTTTTSSSLSSGENYTDRSDGNDKSLIYERQIPFPAIPTFVDVVDMLDSMITPDASIATVTSRTKWNAKRAIVITGDVIIDYLIRASFASDNVHASQLAHALVRSGGLIPTFKVQSAKETFVGRLSTTYVHRGLNCLQEQGLNSVVVYPMKPRPTIDVLLELNQVFADIHHFSVSIDGQFVDYDAIPGSVSFRRALVLLSELAGSNEGKDNEFARVDDSLKKVCWFNLYNLLIFHAKLSFGHPMDIKKRGTFFNSDAAYVVAGKRITSSELEHAVLRRKMSQNDDRIAWRLTEKDPRMHFILNCGAHSCPPLVPLNASTPSQVDEQLNSATRKFIHQNVIIDHGKQKVTLSRLWKWFRKDFTPYSDTDEELLSWIAKHANDEQNIELTRAISLGYKIKFTAYNWADNGDINAKPDIRFMPIYDASFARTA